MSKNNLNRHERAAADMAALSEAGLMPAIPMTQKPEGRPKAMLHLACEGNSLEDDSLEIGAASLPLFDTHGSRHLG